MIRGFIGGVLWGGLLALLSLAVLSQVTAPPTGQALVPLAADGPVAVVVAQQEADGRSDDTKEAAPDTDAEVGAAVGPVINAPEPEEAASRAPTAVIESTPALPGAGTTTTAGSSTRQADVPADAGNTPTAASPSAGEAVQATAAPTDTGPASTGEAEGAAAPLAAADLPAAVVDSDAEETAPAAAPPPATTEAAASAEVSAPVAVQPPQPSTEAPQPLAAAANPSVAALAPVAEAPPPAVANAPVRPASAQPDAAPDEAKLLPLPPQPGPPPELADAPLAEVDQPVVPAGASIPGTLPAPPPPELAAADTSPPDALAPRPAPAPDSVASDSGPAEGRPSRLVPDAGLGAVAGTARADRLPRIIGPAAQPDPAPSSADPVLIEAEAADERPAIERHASKFENPAGKPIFAVVLIDNGEPSLDRRALASVPFPVTFLLDPSRPESAMAASIYREGGQEVAMLATGLPAGATAADLEVTFAAYGDVLPEAVAIVDPEEGGFQGNRATATMVAPIVAGQGRGLLSWDRGLNAAEQVARRQGLRSGVIYRRLDGEGEDSAAMRRYLDRAAFKAAQDGRVIVAGGTRPETVAALLEWAVEGRATTVALAPLSAALVAE